ncbi:glycerol transporter [Mortierella sp. 14UC]|nr:glycerol transporter [Mortierella sp. 14UC]
MQQEHEHHRLLEMNSSPSPHLDNNHNDDESSSFVGHNNNNSDNHSHRHHHDRPITTAKYTKRVQDRTTQPSLWNTKEFYVYYLVFMFCIPYMFKTAHDASSVDNPNYEKYQHLLSDGFFGYKLDNSDGQWAGFRNNLPKLILVASIYLPLSHLYTSFLVPSKTTHTLKHPHQQPLVRTYFFLAFSAIYLYFMYGNSVFKILLIVAANYGIAKAGGNKWWMPVATWAFNVAVLFLNEGYKGYNFSDVHESLSWLDDNTGMDRRWDVHFNFTMLRLVSFNLDYYWSFNSDHELIMEDRDRTPSNDKERVTQPASAGDYCFTYYVAFALYAPLYVAGPIMTFNDFISQTQAWDNDPILQIAMIALFNLVLIWLKLLIIWRFFRLWALLDGIEAPENMIRWAVGNILLMITANLVGFCTGLEGTKMLISEMFSSAQGYITLLGCLGALFVCAQIQFEVRESEKRRGLFLNC